MVAGARHDLWPAAGGRAKLESAAGARGTRNAVYLQRRDAVQQEGATRAQEQGIRRARAALFAARMCLLLSGTHVLLPATVGAAAPAQAHAQALVAGVVEGNCAEVVQVATQVPQVSESHV